MKMLIITLSFLMFSCSHLSKQAAGKTNTLPRDVSSTLETKPDLIEVLDPTLKTEFIKFNLQQTSDLIPLKQILEDTLASEDSLSTAKKLNNDYFKSVKWSVKFIDQLLKLDLAPQVLKANELYVNLLNITHSLKNRFVYPFDKKIEVFNLLSTASKYTYKPVISIPENIDLSPVEIIPISNDVASKEITRTHLLDPKQIVCSYEKAKDGWGFKPGFKVLCGENKYKIKFGNETLSGPFNSRIYRTLGYLTPEIDVITDFRMKYDRRLITEFNSQKEVNVDVKVLGIKVKEVKTKNKKDPFNYIKNVTLKDSSILTAQEFKQKLLNTKEEFDETLEAQVNFITFSQASITESLPVVEVGPWAFDEPNYQNNPTVRQGIIVSAWVGNSDLHMNNNRLIIEKTQDKLKPLVYPIFVDVGYGLGRTDKATGQSSSDIENMNWIISSKSNTSNNSDQQMQIANQVVFSGFISQRYSELLSKLQFQDAYFALKNICRLTSKQINSALVEAGASEELARIGTSKLLNRRSQLIQDLGIQDQMKTCYEPQKIN
ncbi:MAG: hypothetical protein WA160_04430 [Pseudobdellovibrio sp.]